MKNFLRFDNNKLDIVISTKENGNMLYQMGGAEVYENYQRLSQSTGIDLNKIVRVILKNSSEFIEVDRAKGGEGVLPDKQNLMGYDGIITKDKNLYIAITTADCFPVIIHDPVNDILGLAHCGWRGIVEQLEVKIMNKMIEMGSSIDDLEITYGPGICRDCYIQHNEYLRDVFIQQYCYPLDIIEDVDGHYAVDIKLASQYNLREAGYAGDFKELNLCNYCDDRLFSVRRDGKETGRIVNLVAML